MRFTTTIEQEAGKNHAGVPVPEEVVEALGAGKRPAVVATVGALTYRTTVAPMGGRYWLSLSGARREEAGVAGGDTIEVNVELDTEPRTVEVPEDLAAALEADSAAAAAFQPLSYSRKSRLVLNVEGAKTEATRQRRVAKAVEDLKAGKA